MTLDTALIELDIHKSYMRSRRLIEREGVAVNGVIETDYYREVNLEDDNIYVDAEKKKYS